MKKLVYALIAFVSIAATSCFDDSGGKTDEPVDIGEKVYTMNLLEDAEFYYFTASKAIYAYKAGSINITHLTANVSQSGIPDTVENIDPLDMYKLGWMYFITVKLNDVTRYFRQYNGEIIEITDSEMMRRPDITHQQMNNGRFSITTNTWEEYTVSDIRNLTTSSGISRTLMCTGYYIGSYLNNESNYGLWFCAKDEGLSLITSGLYYYPELTTPHIKIIDEPGELW
jgi:hypothetical protein